jgi:hypothetical protein
VSNTLQQPQNEAEQAEVDYGEHVIWQLVGSTITSFGANEAGEILLSARTKTGAPVEFIIGKDERGDIALFEVERKEVQA